MHLSAVWSFEPQRFAQHHVLLLLLLMLLPLQSLVKNTPAESSYTIVVPNPDLTPEKLGHYACGKALPADTAGKLFAAGQSVEKWPLTSVMYVTSTGQTAADLKSTWVKKD